MKRLIAGVAAAASMACGQQVACVARGTRVATPRGARRVEDLEVGDAVIAVDPLTGRFETTVLSAVRSAVRECGAVQLGGVSLVVTSDHPLFDPASGAFHPAGDWLLGQRTMLSVFDGERVRVERVEAVQRFVRVETVFDLTVESELHTFVAEGIVVHNKQPADCSIPSGGTTNLTEPVQERPLCTCADGDAGRWTCNASGGAAVCSLCGMPDGG